MNRTLVESVLRAVLYEGYMLYPYRRSALKNQKRWQFGALYPQEYLQTECLAIAGRDAVVNVEIRWLQQDGPESIERQVEVRDVQLTDMAVTAAKTEFTFPNVCGTVEVSGLRLEPSVARIRVVVSVLNGSMQSTHAILHLRGGEFVSLIDPPEHLRAAAAECVNVGVWPVLAGDPADRDCMLCSPIILYDYPRVAPETDGDLFDCTEIDEMLRLRIQTMAAFEKDEMRSGDPRTREILDRVLGAGLVTGNRVRLRPKAGGDIFDLALEGRMATIEAIEEDFEGRVHVAVVVDDDPGRDLGYERQPGHRFFFSPDEVEPIP
jgi:hypothetical protein